MYETAAAVIFAAPGGCSHLFVQSGFLVGLNIFNFQDGKWDWPSKDAINVLSLHIDKKTSQNKLTLSHNHISCHSRQDRKP